MRSCGSSVKAVSLLLLIIVCSFTELSAQEALELQRIEEEVRFDGIPDEDFWNSVDPLPMIMHQPVYGNEPTEESDIRICYDKDYLYIGVKFYMQDPSMIRAFGKKRDYSCTSCDFFGFAINASNDKENAHAFYTTPLSERWDASIKNDGMVVSGIDPMNISWNTFWDTKSVVNEKGWSLEMRIPFSSLRFEEVNGEVRMRLSAFRWIASKGEGDIFPDIPYNWGGYSKLRPSLAQEVILRGIKSKNPVYVSPYVLTGFEQENSLNDSETEYEYHENYKFEPGLDIKYSLTNNLTLDLTANTDFAQVEADAQQINLTRFSLYFPEKRVFFLERASIFDFGLGGPNNLFYSRRIGLSEGEPIRIYGGARLTGRVGKWDLGFLNMQTAEHITEDNEKLPSENFGVFRLRRKVFNPYSTAGGMLTSRLGTDGSYNVAYGIDGAFRLYGDDYLTMRWAQTFENDSTNNPLSLSPTRFLIEWARRNNEGFAYDILYSYSGEQFNPGIGLEIRENYSVLSSSFQYGWLPGENSKLTNHMVKIYGYAISGVLNGTMETAFYNVAYDFETKTNTGAVVSIDGMFENVTDTLKFQDDVYVPNGEYYFWDFTCNYYSSYVKPLTVSVFFRVRGLL